MNKAGIKNRTNIKTPVAKGVILGVLSALAVAIGMTLLMTFAISAEKVEINKIELLIKFIWTISAAAGCLVGIGREDKNKIIKAAVIVVGFLLVLIIISAVLFDMGLQDIVWGILCSAAGGLIGCAVKTSGGKHTKRKWKL